MQAIADVLSAAHERVVDRALGALLRLGEPHYAAGDARRKLADLLDRLVSAIAADNPAAVGEYSAGIARQRLQEGFDLTEVQGAFNVLEEALWAEVVATLDASRRVQALEAITMALREGRDAVAATYVALAREERLPERPPAGPSGESLVVRETVGRVGVLTMVDAEKRNALGSAMAAQIMAALDWFAGRDCRAVVLRSAPGMSVWSSGHDVGELPRGRRDPLPYNDPLEQCVRAVRSFHLPVIAMIHGSVWGGAFELVLSSDVVIADETATFAVTPANLGLPYNTAGILHFFGRIPLNVVKEMFFTAEPIDAPLAERWLVVNHLVPADRLEEFTLDLAARMASKAPLAIAAVKEQLRVLSDYQPVAAQVYERIQSLRQKAYDSSDYLEGLAAFAEKRPPSFRGL